MRSGLRGLVFLSMVGAVSVSALAADQARKPMAGAHGKDRASGHVLTAPSDVKWEAGPASLPAGAQVAVLDGDPAAAAPFTMRLKVPAGYRIPAHDHPQDERVTVISGSFSMGMGDVLDTSRGRKLAAGSFALMPAGENHFAWADSEAVLQLNGVGPWGITYVNAADDPRNASQSAETVAPAALTWAPAPGLPAGSMVAVLDGDPGQPGPFVIRIKFPDGTVVAPHVHPAAERVTILSGSMDLGGAEGSKTVRLPAGGFFVMPAGVVHGGKARGETIIEIHATGPWDLTYEDPADDPRRSTG